MLNEKLKQDILNYIEDVEIDVEDLESYEYHSAIYSYGNYMPEPSWSDWDDEEEKKAKIEKFISWLETDLVGDYIEIDDDIHEKDYNDRQLTNEVIEWLKGKI